MLAPDGRCRAFDADGKGYVRAEGGALLFLKPLRRAEADGDPIHAVIIGSGVNADGRSKGLSMPRTEAQEGLLRSVYEQAEVGPESVCYLEAHGTGTVAGIRRKPRPSAMPWGSPEGRRALCRSVRRRRTWDTSSRPPAWWGW